jgi:hypothetical protein
MYFRGLVNTTWFPLRNFVAYFLLQVLGFTLVSTITMQRSDPFMDGNQTYDGIKYVMISAPILFFASGIIALRSEHDLSGYCTEHILTETSLGETPTCHTYSEDELFEFNLYQWGVGFFAFGLQFSHADIGPMKRLTLDPEVMKTWGIGMWILFFAVMGLLIAVLYVVYQAYSSISLLSSYLILLIAIIGFFVYMNKKQGE